MNRAPSFQVSLFHVRHLAANDPTLFASNDEIISNRRHRRSLIINFAAWDLYVAMFCDESDRQLDSCFKECRRSHRKVANVTAMTPVIPQANYVNCSSIYKTTEQSRTRPPTYIGETRGKVSRGFALFTLVYRVAAVFG